MEISTGTVRVFPGAGVVTFEARTILHVRERAIYRLLGYRASIAYEALIGDTQSQGFLFLRGAPVRVDLSAVGLLTDPGFDVAGNHPANVGFLMTSLDRVVGTLETAPTPPRDHTPYVPFAGGHDVPGLYVEAILNNNSIASAAARFMWEVHYEIRSASTEQVAKLAVMRGWDNDSSESEFLAATRGAQSRPVIG